MTFGDNFTGADRIFEREVAINVQAARYEVAVQIQRQLIRRTRRRADRGVAACCRSAFRYVAHELDGDVLDVLQSSFGRVAPREA